MRVSSNPLAEPGLPAGRNSDCRAMPLNPWIQGMAFFCPRRLSAASSGFG